MLTTPGGETDGKLKSGGRSGVSDGQLRPKFSAQTDSFTTLDALCWDGNAFYLIYHNLECLEPGKRSLSYFYGCGEKCFRWPDFSLLALGSS